jgi:hypothetical protein
VTRAWTAAFRIMGHARTLGIFLGVLTGLLSSVPAMAQSQTAGTLAERLDAAIRQVEAAYDRDAPLPDPDALFPETEEVIGSGDAMQVDHTGLRAEWKGVPAEGEARRESLDRLRHRLLAVRAEMPSADAVAGSRVSALPGWREKLTEVLGRPEFKKREAEEDWRLRLFRWLRDKLGFLLPRKTTLVVGDALRWIVYILAGATLLAALFVLVRAGLPLLTRDRRGARASPPSGPAPGETQETLSALADSRARAGDFRGAAQAIFRWMLLRLHRAGRLEYDPALTNREHLARLKTDAAVRGTFERVCRQFELVWYGFQPVAAEEFVAFRTECLRVAGGRA